MISCLAPSGLAVNVWWRPEGLWARTGNHACVCLLLNRCGYNHVVCRHQCVHKVSILKRFECDLKNAIKNKPDVLLRKIFWLDFPFNVNCTNIHLLITCHMQFKSQLVSAQLLSNQNNTFPLRGGRATQSSNVPPDVVKSLMVPSDWLATTPERSVFLLKVSWNRVTLPVTLNRISNMHVTYA